MYESAVVYPRGKSTIARFAKTASMYGYTGLIIRANRDETPLESVQTIQGRYDIDIATAIEIDADSKAEMSGHLGAVRNEYPLIICRGGTPSLNRFAVESPRIDVLSGPMENEGDFNHVLARKAAENNVAIEFSFANVLRAAGGRRVQSVQQLRKLREIITHYDTPYICTGFPHSHLELRAPREMKAVGNQIGFNPEFVAQGLHHWQEIIHTNRKRLSEHYLSDRVKWRENTQEE
ncbi:MAG: RNase P subunit p30 family protein [Halobacteriaceae archaeon]